CLAARRDSERLWAWGTVTLMIAFAVALTFWQIRAGPAAQLLAIPPVAWALWALLARLFYGGIGGRLLAGGGLVLLGSAANSYSVYPLVAEALADNTPAPAAEARGTPLPRNGTDTHNRSDNGASEPDRPARASGNAT